ncbi:hypothetical protein HMPREF1546_00923 [Oscillibacter sp. KLE 1745]|nr:hypothetical protein HMPREF1546_00923 [Oscillibacter sp. KLE 1745]
MASDMFRLWRCFPKKFRIAQKGSPRRIPPRAALQYAVVFYRPPQTR